MMLGIDGNSTHDLEPLASALILVCSFSSATAEKEAKVGLTYSNARQANNFSEFMVQGGFYS